MSIRRQYKWWFYSIKCSSNIYKQLMLPFFNILVLQIDIEFFLWGLSKLQGVNFDLLWSILAKIGLKRIINHHISSTIMSKKISRHTILVSGARPTNNESKLKYAWKMSFLEGTTTIFCRWLKIWFPGQFSSFKKRFLVWNAPFLDILISIGLLHFLVCAQKRRKNIHFV